MRSRAYEYRDRRTRKRDMRKLWIGAPSTQELDGWAVIQQVYFGPGSSRRYPRPQVTGPTSRWREPISFAHLVALAGGKPVAPELIQRAATQAIEEAEAMAEVLELPAAGETSEDESEAPEASTAGETNKDESESEAPEASAGNESEESEVAEEAKTKPHRMKTEAAGANT